MKDQNEEYKLKLVPFIMNRGVKNTGKTPYGVTMIQAKVCGLNLVGGKE